MDARLVMQVHRIIKRNVCYHLRKLGSILLILKQNGDFVVYMNT